VIDVNHFFLWRRLEFTFSNPEVLVFVFHFLREKKNLVVGPCGSCGKLVAALFAAASFPTRL